MTGENLQSVLTPAGTGGIAVLALTGPDALSTVSHIFRFPRSSRPFVSGQIHYGHVVDPDASSAAIIDEVLVAYWDAQSGPTGCDYFEINCHGGTVPVRSLSVLLTRLGFREVSWSEFLFRQVRPAHTRLEWKAYDLAVNAHTTLAARHFFAQFQGALSEALQTLCRLLGSPRPDAKAVRELLGPLLDRASLAMALHTPRTVTVVGRPNVGKSTLANLLVGSERSLVHHQPGTTRDAVSSLVSISGVPLRVVDTAGLRNALDEVEAAGVRISRDKLTSADLVLWVFDHSRPLDRIEDSHLELLRGKRVLAVVNKMDLPGALPEPALIETLGGSLVHIRALEGVGLDLLKSRILETLFGGTLPEVGSPLVFDADLHRLLEQILADLDADTQPDLSVRRRMLADYLVLPEASFVKGTCSANRKQ